jgi:hypothetical protein
MLAPGSGKTKTARLWAYVRDERPWAGEALTVICTALHALLIEGMMEMVSKIVLCALAVAATVKLSVDLRIWTRRGRPHAAGR